MNKLLFFIVFSIKCFGQSDFQDFKKDVVPSYDNINTTRTDKFIKVTLSNNNQYNKKNVYLFDKQSEKLLAIFFEKLNIIEADNLFIKLTPNMNRKATKFGETITYNDGSKTISEYMEDDKSFTVMIKFHIKQ
ncbi:hypothetical protein GCM10011514_25790 [Emticicia aquatilis]|uniref:Uncharacterized protein n=1 Tax=Emticicia aquatilis TaxID=1537369 RepID=A0A916YTV7_9BACT|nr:hypothetical protein [Emticicia aquatilis]GGD60687.1 hypothetical protein GCM10011514_25790 [Emticicia aquatilis]